MAKSEGKNRHGLSRHIPKQIKEVIRKDAGYGCVFCGCVLVEYEHIEPEFHNAVEHLPSNMTLLCPMCHDKVTKKIISKKQVWSAKLNPKGLEQGFVSDTLFPNADRLEFQLGNMRYLNMGVAISFFGKPLFWFEEPEQGIGACTVCCIFYGIDGKPIAYVNRNEFIALVGNLDVVSVGSKLTISDKDNGCILDISRIGDEPLHVTKIYMQLYQIKLVVEGANSGLLFGRIDQPKDKLSRIGSLTLEGGGLESKAIEIGSIPAANIGNRLHVLICSILSGTPIVNCFGHHKGWQLDGMLINFNGEQVGIVQNFKAYSIAGEFVSHLKNNGLTYPYLQYEDGEPIYRRPGSIKGWAVRVDPDLDLSHRFFGF
jgi:hypothetical protein